MSKYYIEVQLYNRVENKNEWKKVKPVNGKPYEYDNITEAEHDLNMCYGHDYGLINKKRITNDTQEVIKQW